MEIDRYIAGYMIMILLIVTIKAIRLIESRLTNIPKVWISQIHPKRKLPRVPDNDVPIQSPCSIIQLQSLLAWSNLLFYLPLIKSFPLMGSHRYWWQRMHNAGQILLEALVEAPEQESAAVGRFMFAWGHTVHQHHPVEFKDVQWRLLAHTNEYVEFQYVWLFLASVFTFHDHFTMTESDPIENQFLTTHPINLKFQDMHK